MTAFLIYVALTFSFMLVGSLVGPRSPTWVVTWMALSSVAAWIFVGLQFGRIVWSAQP